MKKHIGKITITSFILLLTAILFIVGYMSSDAKAATIAAHKTIIHGSYTNPYVVFFDAEITSPTCGAVRDKSTGIASTAETYAGNALAVGAGITLDSESNRWVVSVPPLPAGKKKTIMCICDNATPVKTDIPFYQDFYDPSDN